MTRKSIPIDDLRELFTYEPSTGILRWKKKVAKKVTIGAEAGGFRPDGYRSVRCVGHRMLVHRVIWAIYTGQWPEHEIDHINGQKSDNRITNLRPATIAQNRKNSKLRFDNVTGEKGVTYCPDRKTPWMVRIQHRFVGYFDTLEEAITARRKEEKHLFGEFSYHLRPAGAQR